MRYVFLGLAINSLYNLFWFRVYAELNAIRLILTPAAFWCFTSYIVPLLLLAYHYYYRLLLKKFIFLEIFTSRNTKMYIRHRHNYSNRNSRKTC